jgi:hypothetical protein
MARRHYVYFLSFSHSFTPSSSSLGRIPELSLLPTLLLQLIILDLREQGLVAYLEDFSGA